jgi:FKBP-type peptidyl-prolyl cis-trans isomerase 2
MFRRTCHAGELHPEERLAVRWKRRWAASLDQYRSSLMAQAKVGDRVRVQCVRVRTQTNGTGTAPRSKLPGSKASSPKPSSPKLLEFIVGSPGVMPGLSNGVAGMSPGELRRFTLQPDDAYGPVQPGLIKEIPRHQFPKRIVLRVGKRLSAMSTLSGSRRKVRVVEIKPGVVVVDGNHLLAGKVVELDVTMISIDASADASCPQPQLDLGGRS